MRKSLLVLFALIATFSLAQTMPAKKSAKKLTPKQVHESALVVDTHADTPQRLLDEQFDLADPPAGDQGHMSFAKAKAGNLGAEFFSIWVDPEWHKGQFVKRTMQLIDSVYEQVEKHPDKMMMAFSTADILKARKQKKLAALMGIEGGHSIENDMGLLRDFYRLGVRYMTLTWSNTNEFADSSGDEKDETLKHHGGMTQHGREIIREMNRLGMMVDISHVSDKTFYQVITISRAPVIASHSSARALTDHPRNMTDDMLRAIKNYDGVVMVNFFSAFIDDDFRKQYQGMKDARDKAEKELREKLKGADAKTLAEALNAQALEWREKIPRAPLKSLIDHIDHIAKVAGVDHVGLGSDFDGVSYNLPEGLDSAADLPKITEELMKRGYSAADCHKILGGNLMRVFKAVEKMRDRMAAEGEQMPLQKRKNAPKD
ncbi:MAG: membrane dipeptidase [Acidobacteriales bacterium]|nr:membrane dipeptidase [Terriglobales bacterium]